jgi:hypothetical protein
MNGSSPIIIYSHADSFPAYPSGIHSSRFQLTLAPLNFPIEFMQFKKSKNQLRLAFFRFAKAMQWAHM